MIESSQELRVKIGNLMQIFHCSLSLLREQLNENLSKGRADGPGAGLNAHFHLFITILPLVCFSSLLPSGEEN